MHTRALKPRFAQPHARRCQTVADPSASNRLHCSVDFPQQQIWDPGQILQLAWTLLAVLGFSKHLLQLCDFHYMQLENQASDINATPLTRNILDMLMH